MASAERTTKSVERVETVEEKRVRLDLSEGEAMTLKSLLYKVTGSYTSSYRKDTQAILSALDDADLFVWANRFGEGCVTARAC